jgi:dihydropyrimidinase
MSYDLVIKNGLVVTSADTAKADIGIKGERISAIGEELSGVEEIDASGKLVTPGAVDIHVHLDMPIGNFTSTDDFYDGSVAAAFGGTTSIVDFVECKKSESMTDALSKRMEKAKDKSIIDYSFHMTIGPNEIAKLDQVKEAFEAGCKSFKLYMAYGLKLNDGELFKSYEAIKNAGGIAVVHAENWDVITVLIEKNIAKGNRSPRWHPLSRPPSMEGEAIRRAIEIASIAGCPVHIFHISCVEAAYIVAEAQGRGCLVTGETCPQYLFKDSSVLEAAGVDGALPVCSPPIREIDQQEGLWRALSSGYLQVISTDHCPFTKKEKESGLKQFNHIPGGVPSIEMRFPAMFSRGIHSGYLTMNQWIEICCTNPAKIIGLDKKGDIQIGYDADIVIFDPEKRKILSVDTLHESADWTLYDGLEVTGWPATVLRRGEKIIDNGKLSAKKGSGKYTDK